MTPSSRDLLIANLITGSAALAFDWPLGWLLWPYWLQSVIVGWYARKRILALRNFSTAGFTSNGKPVPANERGKRSTASFFALHFGFFHLVYLIFLITGAMLDGALDLLLLAGCGFSFAIAQRDTYAAQTAADARGRPNLGALMFLPYLRIVPIHLTIIFGAGMQGMSAVLLFVPLKTAADLALDALDRRLASKAAAAA